MTKKITLIALFIFLTTTLLSAQSLHTIRGTVVDEYGAPLPFVNIFLTTSRTGTVTNSEGAFSLTLPGSEDVMNVSFMGYETQTFNVNRNTGHLNIQLTPSAYLLGEIIVTNLSAANLLRRTIERVPENNRFEPFLVKVYARHKFWEADTLLYMQEVMYNIVKSYDPSFTDEYFLVRNRNFQFAEGRTTLGGTGFGGIAKHASRIFNARFFRNNDIRFLPSSTFDNRPVYVLGFSQRNNNDDDKGRIYIDVEDLAFVRFELISGGGNNLVTVQYRKIDNKYYLMFGNIVTENRRGNRIRLAESDFLVTDIIHSFSREDIEGIHIMQDDILSTFATHEQDTLFWQQHHTILPDSIILAAIERYTPNLERNRLSAKDSVQLAAHLRRLYTPNLSLVASSDLVNDFSSFNHFSNSVNRYILHSLNSNTRGITQTLSGALYTYLTFPFQEVAAEWLLLNKNGIRAKVNPFVFDRRSGVLSPQLHGLNNAFMSNFKNDSFFDFMRLHTVRHERNYINSLLLEEEIARIDLSNRNNLLTFMQLYWLELLVSRSLNIYSASRRDVRTSNRSEERQPLIIDRQRSWVKYLFRPEAAYQRHVLQDDLTNEERRFLRRSAHWSWLNLVSPQMFFIPKFSLGDRNSFTFSLNYLRVPFGEMFGQNIWLMHNHNQLHGIFFRQYRSYAQTTFGIGYRLYDVPLFRNIYMTSSVDFWQQPTDFDFRATTSFSGFRIGQTFEYQLIQNQFSGRNRFSLLVGYDFKTKGYTPHSFFMGRNLNVRTGFKWYWR